jgi:protein-disulfide isomerase
MVSGRGKALLLLLVLLSCTAAGCGGDDKKATTTTKTITDPEPPPGAASPFTGIPQTGVTLGNPHAKVAIYEFADLQCPFCKEFTLGVFPQIVQKYVKTGKVKLVWRNLTFIGRDSVTAARAAAAAGAQNRLWNFVDVFYKHQGTENSGYVTDRFIADVAAEAGADPAKVKANLNAPFVEQQLGEAQRQAQQFGVNSTPSFLIQVGSRKPQKLDYRSFDLAQFSGPIERAVAAVR